MRLERSDTALGALPGQRQQLIQAGLRPALAQAPEHLAQVRPRVAQSVSQLATTVYSTASRRVPSSLLANSQFLRPRAAGRGARSV